MLCKEVASREVISCPDLISHVEEHLPLSGILKQQPDGFTYIDLSDRYIHELITMLPIEGFEEPPYFGLGLIGAHITVAMPEEWARPPTVAECGKLFSFTVKQFEIVHPLRMEVSAIFLLTIDAPELNALRETYGLEPLPFDFHITIGVKKF